MKTLLYILIVYLLVFIFMGVIATMIIAKNNNVTFIEYIQNLR